jgi:hypothetical protein
MLRAATALLALTFMTTAGVAGATLHLCGMQELVLRHCCCQDAHDGPPVQLKRVDDCCGALFSKGEQPPFSSSNDRVHVDAPMLSLSALATDFSHVEPTRAPAWIPLARGSPVAHGPPIFIWNCSYLT